MVKRELGMFVGDDALPFFRGLLAACQAAPSADNSQPCHVDCYASKVVIRYDSERVSGFTFPFKSQATLLSAGGVIENIAQYCEQAGVNIAITYLPANSLNKEVFAEIAIELTGQFSCADITSFPFFRHTNRFAYQKKAIPQDMVDKLESMVVGSSKIQVFNDYAEIDAISRQVQGASEVRFQTQEVHEWLGKSLRYNTDQADKGDGLDIATLDLPPGGGLFLRFISNWSRMRRLNNIGAYKLLAAIDVKPIKKAPALVAFTAADSLVGALEAGRLLVRVWTYLNSQGIACHPYYVISDQLERLKEGVVPDKLIPQAKRIAKGCRELLDLKEGETLMMLLRIGYPMREAPRSQRLPINQVFTALEESVGTE